MTEPPVETSDDGARAKPRRAGHNVLDLILALSAIFISLVSLFVAIDHGNTERQLVAESAWPFLRAILDNGYNDNRDIAIGVSNGGVGPAKVESLELFYDGRPLTSGNELLRQCCGLARGADVHAQLPQGMSSSLIDSSVLRPGEDVAVLRVHRSASGSGVPEALAAKLLRVSFRACYCSVLNECWISDLRSTRPTPVRACTAPAHPFTPNGP